MGKLLSIVICTHNRVELLRECLNSLINQTAGYEQFDVLIVDNGSEDDTKNLCRSFCLKFNNFSYVLEPEIGLSAARNTGFETSHSDWVTYLDDDAKAHKDFVQKIIEVITSKRFDIIGGIYLQWFRVKKPIWFPKDEGTNKFDFSHAGIIEPNKFASGGNMTINKRVFDEIGDFKTSLGMKGGGVFYGEEIEFQRRARQAGFVIGVDPRILIDHLVREDKLSVNWWLNSYFQKGRSSVEIFDKKGPRFLILIIKGLSFAVAMLPYYLVKMLIVQEFRWGEFVIKYFGPLCYLGGQFKVNAKKSK